MQEADKAQHTPWDTVDFVCPCKSMGCLWRRKQQPVKEAEKATYNQRGRWQSRLAWLRQWKRGHQVGGGSTGKAAECLLAGDLQAYKIGVP